MVISCKLLSLIIGSVYRLDFYYTVTRGNDWEPHGLLKGSISCHLLIYWLINQINYSYRYSRVSVEPDPRVVGVGAFTTRDKLIAELRVDEFNVGLLLRLGDGNHHGRWCRRLQGVRSRLTPFPSFLLPRRNTNINYVPSLYAEHPRFADYLQVLSSTVRSSIV